MGKVFDGIDERLAEWIGNQPLFFVATAPGSGGSVNLSPKGPIESLRILSPHRVAYLDLIGSGAETIAHLRDNGRIVLMLCAFAGPPRILRLHGNGRAVLSGDPEFEELAAGFALPDEVMTGPARRAVVVIEVERVADSCGYGVPQMTLEGIRPQQRKWAESKLRQSPDALVRYVAEKNDVSIDGLPAVPPSP
jgi:hypothetical protein